MKIRQIFNVLAACTLVVCMQSCTGDDQPDFVVPAPDPDKENTGNNDGTHSGDGGQTDQATASLCNPEDLGQTPMIIAYYTENSSKLPDPACLTHINYAHGRFVNRERYTCLH